MTASQMRRIRRKLEQARELTDAAHELAIAGHADHGLRELTTRAADDMARATRNLGAWDDRMRMHMEAIARDLRERGETIA